jgi:hypothetical protein
MASVVELKAQAKELGIKGYSKMNKAELEKAVKPKPGLTYEKRMANYHQQNGSAKITARQSRRLRHKFNKVRGK